MLFVLLVVFEAVALHFPTPSGVPEQAAPDIRGAWHAAAAVGRLGGAFVPDALDRFLDDKAVHLMLFFPLGFLLAFERRLLGRLDPRVALMTWVGLLLYAAVGEAAANVVMRG